MKRWYLALGFIVLSVIVLLFFFSSTNSPVHNSYPQFQPGIWDEPVIESPDWWNGSDLAYPFMFSYNLTASRGFDRIYRTYYRPTFILARGHTADIGIDLVSHSGTVTNVSFLKTIDLPDKVSVRMIPESVPLGPYENKTITLEIVDLNPSRSVYGEIDINESESVGLFLKGNDWVIGQAFYLRFD